MQSHTEHLFSKQNICSEKYVLILQPHRILTTVEDINVKFSILSSKTSILPFGNLIKVDEWR